VLFFYHFLGDFGCNYAVFYGYLWLLLVDYAVYEVFVYLAMSPNACAFYVAPRPLDVFQTERRDRVRRDIHVVKAEGKKGKQKKVYWIAGLKDLSLSELLEFS
jgi:hypothetical protein